MKVKHYWLLLFTMPCIAVAQQQEDEESFKRQLDSLQKQYSYTERLYRDSLIQLQKNYQELSKHVQLQGMMIQELKDKRVSSARSQYERNVTAIRTTSLFCEQAFHSIQALRTSIAGTYYFNNISNLHNPTNNELGFSLKDATIRLAQDKVFSKTRKFKKEQRMIGLMQHIFDSPLSKAVSAVVPAVHYFQSATQLVYKAAFEDESIPMEALREFEDELQKYLNYYEALATANKQFQQNLSGLQVRVQAMQNLLYEFVREQSADLYPRQNLQNQTLDVLLKQYYQYAKVDSLIKQIELQQIASERRLNYEELAADKRLVFSVLGVQKVNRIYDETEALYREYLSLLDGYHEHIHNILESSRKLSSQPDAITKKVNELKQQYSQLRESIVRSVGIETLRQRLQAIPRY